MVLRPERPATLSLHENVPAQGDLPKPLESAPSETLETVYRNEAGNLAAYFRTRLKGDDDPSDYVHEVFARLARYMATAAIRQPHHYLRRIARNLLVERSRRLQHRTTYNHVPLCSEIEPPMRAAQSDWIEAQDMLKVYRQTLDELPPKTREVFLLHRVDELGYKEIGERLAISIPTVQYHMKRALAHLDTALGQE
jgi:RNA polymerase sigma-70 factor (ECF subfamily)